ncbi:hypothetical protein FB451DRAFT_1402475 [Mycena latifolia]|nr:hypothetical protein FB451DRAFT_1402475 [Mycena latifolia]
MARTFIPRKTYIIIFLFNLFLFGIAPPMLAAYPQTAALASAIEWVLSKGGQGIATLALLFAVYTLYSLVGNAHAWLAGTPRDVPKILTPAELEDGTPQERRSHHLAVLEAEVSGVAPPAPPVSDSPAEGRTAGAENMADTAGEIALVICYSVFFFYEFVKHEPTVREKTLLEVLGAAALFILRGLEVLFVGVILLLVARRATGSGAPSAAEEFEDAAESGRTSSSPVDVLFDEETEDFGPTTKKEKEYRETEKA